MVSGCRANKRTAYYKKFRNGKNRSLVQAGTYLMCGLSWEAVIVYAFAGYGAVAALTNLTNLFKKGKKWLMQ